MAIIKDLVEIGKSFQKLETAQGRLDDDLRAFAQTLYDTRAELHSLIGRVEKLEQRPGSGRWPWSI